MISVIIPVKNGRECLPRLLDSISIRGVSDLEVIVGLSTESKDESRQIAEYYGCKIVEGGLPAVGRNNGAKHSNGEILVFKDADSPFPSNFLNLALQEFNERELDVAGTIQYPLSTKNGFTALRYRIYLEFFVNNSLRKAQNTSSPLMMNCMFARKNVHEAIGGFDETIQFGEDCEYAKRAKRAGYKFGILKIPGKIGFNMRRFEKKEFTTLLRNVYFNIGRAFGHEFRRDSLVKYW